MAYAREGPRIRGGGRVPRTFTRMRSGGEAQPFLSTPLTGTPTTDGATTPSVVVTNAALGTLYWAVVTNGGAATNAQIIAGSGGNIVAGVAGNQAITVGGKQTIVTITGLTTATTYQILYLQVTPGGLQSNQASVTLTTI